MSSLDASDEMLRFMIQLLRTGYKDVNGVVHLPSNIIKSAREWDGNIKFVKEMFNRTKKDQIDAANAKSPQELKEVIDKSLIGAMIRIPGDNDKIVFEVKSKDMKEFAEYMKDHGDASYVMVDMKTTEGAEPGKIIILDKGELNKAQDFLRGKGIILDGKNTYVFPKEFIAEQRDKYREFVKEVEIETERDKAMADNKLDRPNEHAATDLITNETHVLSETDASHIDDAREHVLDRAVGTMEPASVGFLQRSDEICQSKNGNLSERSGQGLSTSRSELQRKPRKNAKNSVLSEKKNERINPKDLHGTVLAKAGNRAVYGERGLTFVKGLQTPLKDDFVIDCSGLDPSALKIFKASELDGFNMHEFGENSYVSFGNKQIDEFIRTLSPDASKPLNKTEVLEKLAVGDKNHLAKEINKFELKRLNPPKEKAQHSMAKNREMVKEKREAMKAVEEKSNEMTKKLTELIGQALGKVDLGAVLEK